MGEGTLGTALGRGWQAGTAGLAAGVVQVTSPGGDCGGGGGGAVDLSWGAGRFKAAVMQVVMFMWLRTVMNHQYRHGGSTRCSGYCRQVTTEPGRCWASCGVRAGWAGSIGASFLHSYRPL